MTTVAAGTPGYLPCDLVALCRAINLTCIAQTEGRYPITDEDVAVAIRKISPSALRGTAGAKPKAKVTNRLSCMFEMSGLRSIIGQKQAVTTLTKMVVDPFEKLTGDGTSTEEGHVFIEPPVGLILSGPTGSGKTHIALSLAQEMCANVFAAMPADILASRVGEAEKRLAELFASARRAAPSIVVLEDLDKLIPALPPEEEAETETRVGLVLRAELDLIRRRRMELTSFATDPDRCNKRPPSAMEGLVLVVATVTDPSNLARWLLASHRLSLRVDLEPKMSKENIAMLLRNKLLHPAMGHIQVLTEEDLLRAGEMLASKSAGGAEITACCRAAGINAVRRVIHAGTDNTLSVTPSDLSAATARVLGIRIAKTKK